MSSTRSEPRRSIPWRIVVPFALYVLVSLAGVSLSSIGIDSLRQDPTHPEGHMIGDGQLIRSDEYRTTTPLTLGAIASGESDDHNPLTAPQEFLTGLPSGPISSAILFDARISEWTPLPDEVAFSARWWLPFLLLALGAPAFFRKLTGSRHIGWFAAVLMALSPASAWWSFTTVQILGPTFAAAAALQLASARAHERRHVVAVFWGVVSALLLARTVTCYIPWVAVLVLPIMAAAGIAILVDSHTRRRALFVVGGTAVLALILVGALFLENRDALAAVTDTIYPGARRSTGTPYPFQYLFGATSDLRLDGATGIVGTNQSEASSAFTITLVWAAFLLTQRLNYRSGGHRAAAVTVLTFSTFWLSWTMVSWDRLGLHVPLANQVPANRAGQVLGFLAVALLCLLLPAAPERGTFRVAAAAAGTCAIVAANAGSLLVTQNAVGSTRAVWIAAALLAVVVFLITWRPRQAPAYVAAGVLALAIVVGVNPVLFGLGDLRDSPAGELMSDAGEQARDAGDLWASDSLEVDSLMAANGVPALSGRQLSGPDQKTWSELFPDPATETNWNRGGSYVSFAWTDSDTLAVANPAEDYIQISGSPCAVAARLPDLRHVVTSAPLDQRCLKEVAQFTWSGAPRWVYEVH